MQICQCLHHFLPSHAATLLGQRWIWNTPQLYRSCCIFLTKFLGSLYLSFNPSIVLWACALGRLFGLRPEREQHNPLPGTTTYDIFFLRNSYGNSGWWIAQVLIAGWLRKVWSNEIISRERQKKRGSCEWPRHSKHYSGQLHCQPEFLPSMVQDLYQGMRIPMPWWT